ncbi:hypothetical protein DPSP01_003082 [Paraphaeosphaeria sporulosa]
MPALVEMQALPSSTAAISFSNYFSWPPLASGFSCALRNLIQNPFDLPYLQATIGAETFNHIRNKYTCKGYYQNQHRSLEQQEYPDHYDGKMRHSQLINAVVYVFVPST